MVWSMRLKLGLLLVISSATFGCSLINSLDEVVPPSGTGGSATSGPAAGGAGGAGGGDAGSGDGGQDVDQGLLVVGGQLPNGETWMGAIAPREGVLLDTRPWNTAAIAFDAIDGRWLVFERENLPPEPLVGEDGNFHVLEWSAGAFGARATLQGSVALPWRGAAVAPLNGYLAYVVASDATTFWLHALSIAMPPAPVSPLWLQLPQDERPFGMIGSPNESAVGGVVVIGTVDTASPMSCPVIFHRYLVAPTGALSDAGTFPIPMAGYDCTDQQHPVVVAHPGINGRAVLVLPKGPSSSRTYGIDFAPGPVAVVSQIDVAGGYRNISDVTLDPCENVLMVGNGDMQQLVATVWVDAPPAADSVPLGQPPQRLLWDPFNDYLFHFWRTATDGGIEPFELDVSDGVPELSAVSDWPAMGVASGLRPRAAAVRHPTVGDTSRCD
jgi:hypothetical protein